MRGCPGLISPSCYLPFDSLRCPQMTIRDGDAEKVTCPRTDSSPSYTQGPRSTSWLNQEKRATKIGPRRPSRQLLQKTMHTTRPAFCNRLQVVAPRWLGLSTLNVIGAMPPRRTGGLTCPNQRPAIATSMLCTPHGKSLNRWTMFYRIPYIFPR
jgi:hypothetical protein